MLSSPVIHSRSLARRSEAGYSLPEMLVVVAIVAVVSAIAIPLSGNLVAGFRLSGDARGVSNALGLAKMRAASNFSQSRLYLDRSGNSFHIETYNSTTSAWVSEGTLTYLSTGVSYGFLSLATPPSNTQSTITLPPQCKTGLGTAGSSIANTSCILFNSRGIPVDTSGSPTAGYAVYVTDSTAVYGVTLLATGMNQLWRSGPTTAAWVKQ